MSAEMDAKDEGLIFQAKYELKKAYLDTEGLTNLEVLEQAKILYFDKFIFYRNQFNNNGGEIRSENGSATPIIDAYRSKLEEIRQTIISLNGNSDLPAE